MNKKNGLSRYKREKIMRAFAVDLTATQTAQLLGFNRNTVNRYFGLFRAAIHAHQCRQMARMVGVVECDESYFGPTRMRGKYQAPKRGRGTLKQPVFGIYERGGRVFTEVIPDAKAKTLQQLIRGHISKDSIVMTDGWQGYSGLVDVGYDKHFRIVKYRKKGNPFTEGEVHINGIESFWSFTKRRLAKFNGVKKNFAMHLKECEWRWGKDVDTMVQELRLLMV